MIESMHSQSFLNLQEPIRSVFTREIENILPGTTATVFSARNTRNVRKTATLPKSTKNPTYLKFI